MQLHRQILEPQCNISCPSVASQSVGKMPKFSIFSGGSTQKGEVSFQQWAFEVKSVMQSHMEVILWEGILWSLCRTMAYLVWYLDLHTPISEIMNKLELLCGILQYFNVEFLQAATREDRGGAGICNPFGWGTECDSARISYNVECRQSQEAPE